MYTPCTYIYIYIYIYICDVYFNRLKIVFQNVIIIINNKQTNNMNARNNIKKLNSSF